MQGVRVKKNRMNIVFPVITLVLLFAVDSYADRTLERLKSAVVKIHTTAAAPDYFTPWRLLNSNQTSGSGSVIGNNKILTNAHVVADARYIQVQKHDDPKKYLARVTFISHAADLAILVVDDTSFFKGLKSLSLGKLPNPMQELSVYGYPMGGSSLSITKGIMSRVEHQYYAHSGSNLLAGQIDAAINPGNSGGPVIIDNKIVGVVMQSVSGGGAENLGYFVPPSVIRHVLEDAKDGVRDGFVELGFRSQDLESPAMKASLGLAKNQSGVLIAKVFAGSAADGKLKAGDVITHIDEFSVADDHSIEFRRHQRTYFKYAIDQYHVGDTVTVRYVRAGKAHSVQLTASAQRNYGLVRQQVYDKIPEYVIYGGVVFVPLNMNLIKRWGSDWQSEAPLDFLYARNQWRTDEKQELVVALKILAADVNLGYHDWDSWIIEKINGTAIKNFQQFSQILHQYRGEHTIFSDDSGYRMVIDHAQALASEDEILQIYRIPSSHSPGLYIAKEDKQDSSKGKGQSKDEANTLAKSDGIDE